MEGGERWLLVPEVARQLRVTEWTVRNWLRNGHIQGSRPGGTKAGWRIPESEVKRLLTNRPPAEGAAS